MAKFSICSLLIIALFSNVNAFIHYVNENGARCIVVARRNFEQLPGEEQAKANYPERPEKPSFCNLTQIEMEGCTIIKGKLFVVDKFVRNLTTDEEEKIKVFLEQWKAYMKNYTPYYSQYSATSSDVTHSPEGNKATMTPVAEPQNPKICTLLY
ncbi:hypothetical protein Tcan_13553 [Toxocara canis]|uniref:Pepsin inhibitor-3-like repeated domain-containing protein n=1 Tax=Toxocara canis TaxID=6265 RepID=A0A0B2VSE2_TOXCA|nr:hypothetical protein Tcan_13553 [Toxocara canis]